MRSYGEFVESVADALIYRYQDKLDRWQSSGEPVMSPREYVANEDGYLDCIIDDRLNSADNAKCIIVEHLRNPWSVLDGGSPDYDGTDAVTLFKNDCIEAFCKRVNYIYEHDGR